jgi:hypothetical protein
MWSSTISRCFLGCGVAVVFCFCFSCSRPSERAELDADRIEPEACRDAIVDLIRQQSGVFIGHSDPDPLAAAKLEPIGEGKWRFGVFQFDVHKMTYSAMIGEEGPEPYLYEGKLSLKDGIVTAELPELTRYHRAPE